VLTPRQAFVFVVVSAGALVLAAGMLNPLCLMLSPLALAIVLGYSHTKRFTSLSHVVLGLSLALGPVGAWLAIRGSLAPLPLLLGLAVLLWVAGFDTIYACQDAEFDRREGLHSLPARLGVARALFVARGLHLGAWVALGALFWLQPLHSIYLLGVVAIGLLLVFEHSLVSAADQSRVMQAFNLNGWVSLGYLAVAAVAVWWA
jgi:4-hydroxybenzoate polyprenyltransferase